MSRVVKRYGGGLLSKKKDIRCGGCQDPTGREGTLLLVPKRPQDASQSIISSEVLEQQSEGQEMWR